jgi:hypothetical protein
LKIRITARPSSEISNRSIEISNRRSGAILDCALLLAGAIFLVWVNIGFGLYALTGLLWVRTQETVMDSHKTSTPTIQFATRDGAVHLFNENYIILCEGRLSFCFIRDFAPGQVVPVVYDPAAPERAFVHDWALYSGVITWFLEAGAGLALAPIFAAQLRRRPLSFSVRMGRSRGFSGEG